MRRVSHLARSCRQCSQDCVWGYSYYSACQSGAATQVGRDGIGTLYGSWVTCINANLPYSSLWRFVRVSLPIRSVKLPPTILSEVLMRRIGLAVALAVSLV